MRSKISSDNSANTFKSSSWAVCACLALCFVVDAGIALALFITGMGWELALLPLIAAAVDVAFFFVALVSNFRFRYGLISFLLYIVVYSVLSILTVLLNTSGETHFMTVWAQVAWIAVHVFAIILTLVTYVYSAKNYRNTKVLATIAVAFVLAIMFLAVIVYSVSYSQQGYLGQGFEGVVRPIEYRYDETTDSYRAVKLMDGKGDNIVITDTYNNKPVTNIDCEIFAAEGIRYVSFNGKVSYTLSNVEALKNFNSELEVVAQQEIIDEVKNLFYSTAISDMSNAQYAFNFANIVSASDLSENQVCVTFTYSLESYDRLDGNLLETWIGEKGTTFSVESFEQKYPFFKKSNVHSDDDLNWNYHNSDGYIFTGLKDGDGNNLNGQQINKNYNVPVDFEKIYRVYAGASNDDKYITSQYFKTSIVNGSSVDYRYTAASIADELLSELPARLGFELSWQYSSEQKSKTVVTSLSSQLKGDTSNSVYIYPQWKMLAPIVSVTTPTDLHITYGEKAAFEVTASPAEGADFELSYKWTKKSGEAVILGSETDKASVESMPFDGGGEYTCTVTCESNESSLKSTTVATVNVTVNRRGVEITWTELSNAVYNAADQSVSCSISDSVKMSGDDMELSLSVNKSNAGGTSSSTNSGTTVTLHDAGVYTITVTLSGEDSYKYEITSGERKSYTIAQKTIEEVTWSATCVHGDSHTYDANTHGYTATVTGEGSDVITLEYTYSNGTGEFKNAGSYTVTAQLPTEHAVNYRFKSGVNTKSVTVAKAKITSLAWSSDSNFTYDGSKHQITVTGVTGAVGGEDSDLIANGLRYVISTEEAALRGHEGVYAGTYKITAVLVNNGANLYSNNYQFEESADITTYTVNKQSITVGWTNTSLTYNGAVQYPTISSVTGDIGSEVNNNLANAFTYTNSGDKNVGGTHSVSVVLKEGSVYAINYSISGFNSTIYTIDKATVSISWSTTTSFVYNGASRTLSATCRGLGNDGSLKLTITVSAKEGSSLSGSEAVNFGSYTATASFAGDESNKDNYTLTGATCDFNITAKSVTVNWNVTNWTITYDGQVHIFTATSTALVNGDQFTVTVSGDNGSEVKNAGIYTVTAAITNESNRKNYSLSNDSKTFTINALSIGVNWTNFRVEYNGSAQMPGASYTGVGSDGELPITVTLTQGTAINVGSYNATATISDSTLSKNYKILNETKLFEIYKKTITVSWTDYSGGTTYDGQDHTPTVSNTVLCGSDTLKVTVVANTGNGLVNGKAINVGSYTATASVDQGDSNNYKLENSTKNFTIVAKTITVVIKLTLNGDTYSELPDINTLKSKLSCQDKDSKLVSGDTFDTDNTKYSYSSQNGNVATITADVKIKNANGDATSNYIISVETTTLTITPTTDDGQAEGDVVGMILKEVEYVL